jgi:trehalose synthase
LLLCLCGACSPGPARRSVEKHDTDKNDVEKSAVAKQSGEADVMPMPRADPVYLQYLERNAMLAKSAEMAKVVSGSELAWRVSSNNGSPDSLLEFSDIWLAVHPLTLLTSSRHSVFSQLADSGVRAVLREAGVKGLYLAPLQGGGALWAKTPRGADTGEDVVQYDFSRVAGSEEQYRRLMNSLIDGRSLLGSDLVPAATGIGPDFFLAARNVREYPGIYCMVDIPEELWTNLPEADAEWAHETLDASRIKALNDKGLLPGAMLDELSPLGRKGGWAVTGKVRGVDGNNRRWVYRYYQKPEYPILNWEDPSQTAHRILSGSAVQQVGLRGQALIGLRFDAFKGLEAAGMETGRGAVFSSGIEPALSAAQSMSREIRRYGAWAWLRDDDLALEDMARFLHSGTDFVFDNAFSPAAEHALLTGDAGLARFMADELIRLRIDARRLVHTLPAQNGVSYALPHLSRLAATGGGENASSLLQRVQSSIRSAAAHGGASLLKDARLYTTSAGLAALALHASSGDARAKVRDIAAGHGLLIFFKAMQPGMLMLSGQDLVGLMPLPDPPDGDPANACRGSYSLSASGGGLTVTNLGMPKAPQLYPSPDMQTLQKDSFLARIGGFLRARAQYGLSMGTLVSRPQTKGKGSIALLSRLPDGKSHLLSVCNFSRDSVTESVSLSGIQGIESALSRITPIATGGSHTVSQHTVTMTLGPWQGRALLIGGGGGSGKNTAGGLRRAEITRLPGAGPHQNFLCGLKPRPKGHIAPTPP